MTIKKLEITGFKSFGGRKKLVFEQGITAIVGPNGSGKSNIADAVRWVLGEQKVKRLRVAKSEDVIFFGTPKKPQASLAEVSILLDNSSKRFDIDSSEVEISRKQYRSGDVEYRINGRKTKLSEIGEKLAKAGFGTETYTVIGQGTVDSLITSSGVERKLLFEEASGIRQFEIRRNLALKNIQKAEQNLSQVAAILTELEPATKILQIYSQREDKIKSLKKDLNTKRQQYVDYHMQNLSISLKNILADESKTKDQLDAVLNEIKKFHTLNKQNSSSLSNNMTEKLKSLELQKDNFTQQLLGKQNELEILNSADKNQQRDIDKLNKYLAVLTKKRTHYQKVFLSESEQVNNLQTKIDQCDKELVVINKDLKDVQNKISNNQKKEFVKHALGLVQNARIQLRQEKSRKKIDKSLQSLLQMLELAVQDDTLDLVTTVSKLQRQISNLMMKRDEYLELQTGHTIKLRAVELDISALDLEHQQIQDNKIEQQKRFNETIKIKKDITKAQKDILLLNKKIDTISSEITLLRDEIYKANKNQNSGEIILLAEKNAVKKTELELKLKELTQTKKETIKAIDLTKNLAYKWLGENYKFKNLRKPNAPTIEEINKITTEIESTLDIDKEEIEQAKKTQERIEFLKNQQEDLLKAINDSQKLAQTLQSDIAKKFTQSFKKLNVSFNNYFQKLFGGGEAKLLLSEDNLEYGVEISVSPPNKRSKSLAALSGGERSLASIALLSAIIHTNPSPFIVLDEVDAALDDENSDRFTKILKDLSNKSQILVITHNQETMQSANNLVGITTNIDGDSEVMELNLQKANDILVSK